MAIITKFEREDRATVRTHPTKLVARFIVDVQDGQKILQVNTYGSDDRQIPDKLSQTFQLNEESAKQLWKILGTEFNFR
jgi:hypothetical protein